MDARARNRMVSAGLTFLGNLLFPRLSHRTRWATRLGPRGTLLSVAARVALVLLFLKGVERLAHKQEALKTELRERLGREPTSEEMFDHLMEAREA